MKHVSLSGSSTERTRQAKTAASVEFRVDPTLAAVATVQIALVGALMLITDRFVKLSRVV